MVDLDHFKAVSDTWGHETGNKVLKQAANLITQLLRRVDISSRYDGEEFALILPPLFFRAIQAAERLRMVLQPLSSLMASVYMKKRVSFPSRLL